MIWLSRLFGTPPQPPTDHSEALEARVAALEGALRDLQALPADMVAWEARAMKLTRELSRHLKSIAEVERREQLRAAAENPDQNGDLDEVDEAALDRMLADIKRGAR